MCNCLLRLRFGEEYLRADEEDVECLVQLLSTVGKRLDTPPLAVGAPSSKKKKPVDLRKLTPRHTRTGLYGGTVR